eukprot:1157278-Pelagomonas_calceolata.AAC.1
MRQTLPDLTVALDLKLVPVCPLKHHAHQTFSLDMTKGACPKLMKDSSFQRIGKIACHPFKAYQFPLSNVTREQALQNRPSFGISPSRQVSH